MSNVTGIGTDLGLNNFAKEGRLKSIIGTNALQNPLLNADNGYPIGGIFNGTTSLLSGQGFLPAHWSPCSPTYINAPTAFRSLNNNYFKTDYRPYDDTAKFGEVNNPDYVSHIANINYSGNRVLSMFGVGASMTSFNRNPDRTSPDYPITMCTSPTRTIDASTPWGENDCWAKYEWTQGVSVPDSMNSVTFGAYIRCKPSDLFRELNFGGVYIFQDTAASAPSNVFTNIIAVKKSSHSLSLRSGVCPAGQGQYQWSGNAAKLDATGEKYPQRLNSSCNIESITYKNAEDFADFTVVEKTVTLQAGTSRHLGLGMYFCENHSYLPETPPDPNPLSGAIDFYNPFLIFGT